MLNLLSRSRPATSRCRCITCFAAGAGIVRRASPIPWRLQYKHLTTLFYSSIIATAAAVDVRVKRRRREQWERVIREAEESLREVEVVPKRGVAEDEDKDGTRRREQWGMDGDREQSEGVEEREHPMKVANAYSLTDGLEGTEGNWYDVGPASNYQDEVESLGILRNTSNEAEREKDDNWQERTAGEDSDVPRREDAARLIEALDYGSEVSALHKVEKLLRMTISGNPVPIPAERGRMSSASIYASEFRSANRRRTWTPKKLVMTEISMAKLSTRLLLRCSRDELAMTENPELRAKCHLLEKSLTELNDRLSLVERASAFDLGGIERLHYPQYEYEGEIGQKATEELNQSLARIMTKYGEKTLDFKTTLNKIAYNLMVSPAAPDAKTYAILINRFSRSGHPALAESVIESFVENNARPNEIVVDVMVRHYSRQGHFKKLEELLEKVQGDLGGLMLAKPGIRLDGVGASRLVASGDKVVQAMTLGPQNYYNIISTFLQRSQFMVAQKWWRRMRDEDIEPDAKLLSSFLLYFSRVGDWRRGKGVWATIKASFLDRPFGQMDDQEIRVARSCYVSKLRLCRFTARYEDFRRVYAEALGRGLSMAAVLLPPPPTTLFTREEDVASARRRRIHVLEHRLALIASDVRTWALHVLAAKIVLAGLPQEAVRRMFVKYDDPDEFAMWQAKRRAAAVWYRPAAGGGVVRAQGFVGDGKMGGGRTWRKSVVA